MRPSLGTIRSVPPVADAKPKPSAPSGGTPPSPFTRPKPGMVVDDKYRIERVIGEGGMGTVVEATHVQLDQRVAIKFLIPGATKDEQAAARFSREARAAAKIKNEHVARVSDVGDVDGVPYIVMELLEGRELRRILEKEGKLPVETACEYMLQACEALAAVHAAGIVHRDLKPANLFVTERADGSPVVKLLDFGISKITEDEAEFDASLTTATTVMGSPGYMSPEQLKSTKDVDVRTDVWALGAVLYEALTGRPAFSGESMAQVCAMVASDDPPLPSSQRDGIPVDLERTVMRCLAKKAERRFQDVGELAAAIAPFAPESARGALERIEATLGVRSRPRPTRPSLDAVASAPTELAIPPSRPLRESSSSQSLPIIDPRTMSSVERDAPEKRGTRWGLLLLLAVVAGGAAFAVYSGRINVKQVQTSVTHAAEQVASVAASAAASVSAQLPELTPPTPPSASVTFDPPAPDDSADDEEETAPSASGSASPSTSVAVAPGVPAAVKPHPQPQKRPTRHGGRRHRWH